jgi:ATP phosphoribosyltransferase regulatory subunit
MLIHSLLPEGLRDRLPPFAQAADTVARIILDVLASHGYARVAPPIAEFRETLDSESSVDMGAGSAAVGALSAQQGRDLLRFTDPVSQRTIAIRPDITTQIGRIATTRMAAHPRPLRLCYAGQIVKLRASQLQPEREMMQIGAELIGSDSVTAAQEILSTAVDALTAAGVGPITVDITMPDLVEVLARGPMPLAADKIALVRNRLDAKDAGGLRALGADAAAYLPLIDATCGLTEALTRLRSIAGGPDFTQRLDRIEAIAAALEGRAFITLDPTERHGFEYQSWFGFSLFVAGHKGTIGRGGCYALRSGSNPPECATGFSLFPDPLIDAGLGQAGILASQRLYIPMGSDAEGVAACRAKGWATIAQIDATDDARALGCSHILAADGPQLL